MHDRKPLYAVGPRELQYPHPHNGLQLAANKPPCGPKGSEYVCRALATRSVQSVCGASGLSAAIVVGRFPSLTQSFILNQITGLIDRGVDVDIYAWRSDPPACHQAAVAQYDLLSRTRYLPMASENLVERFAGSMWDLAAGFATSPAASLRSLNMLRFGRSAASLMLLRQARFLHAARRYDIIHCHFGPEGLTGAMLREAGVLCGARLLTSFYGFDLTASIQANGTHYYDPLFERADLLLPLCENFRQRLVNLGRRSTSSRCITSASS